ncbi:hypothetical protein G3O06_23485 [Burkholderia sp. Ac-20345]|uniref:hypothetical protein n=1 Tax=Burkholderia sp. Ac-20345 TaxID=2703891 RepID=UPI00197B7D80|nr:hypothetical protein [Burkholderia sp. Ac-20345]MBN3780480.1 hypothetical protein [Burkholderia sp. Ac-20345]
MRSVGNLIFGGIGGLFVAGMIAMTLKSLDTFAEFMPPVPWAIGVALFLIAVAIGFVRKRFAGLGMVVVWAVGVGMAMMLGQGDDYVTPMREALYSVIPWAFVGCCALACVLNAAIL